RRERRSARFLHPQGHRLGVTARGHVEGVRGTGRGSSVRMVVPGTGVHGAGRPAVAARVLSEALAPAPIVTALLLVAAVVTAHTRADAVRNALIAAVFGALVPLGFVLYQVRRRRFTDHHVSVRRQRPIVFAVA